MVCVLALQAAVPAQASIWSSVVNWWNHVPEQSKRTAGMVAASVTALFALGYSAYALCKKKKKVVAISGAPVVNASVELTVDNQGWQALKGMFPVKESKMPDYAFMPVFAGVTYEESQQMMPGNIFAEIEKRYTKLKNDYRLLCNKYEDARNKRQYPEAKVFLSAIKQLLYGDMHRLWNNMRSLIKYYRPQDSQYNRLMLWIAERSTFIAAYIKEKDELDLLENVDQLVSAAIFG
jgi:hypothetical protein